MQTGNALVAQRQSNRLVSGRFCFIGNLAIFEREFLGVVTRGQDCAICGFAIAFRGP